MLFGGHDSFREPLTVDAESFIGVKSVKARGKRISTYQIETVNELEPMHFAPEEEDNRPVSVHDEEPGEREEQQMNLFDV